MNGNPVSNSTIVLSGAMNNNKYFKINPTTLVPHSNAANKDDATPLTLKKVGSVEHVLQHGGKFGEAVAVPTQANLHKLVMNTTNMAQAIRFTVEDNQDGSFSLKAGDGRYLEAEFASDSPLLLKSTNHGDQTKFLWGTPSDFLSHGQNISFFGTGQRYFVLDSNSNGVRIGSATSGETFTVEVVGNNRIAIKASNGKYLTVDDSIHGRVFANADSVDDSGKFLLVQMGPDKLALKGYNNKFLRPAYASGGAWLCNSNNAEAYQFS